VAVDRKREAPFLRGASCAQRRKTPIARRVGLGCWARRGVRSLPLRVGPALRAAPLRRLGQHARARRTFSTRRRRGAEEPARPRPRSAGRLSRRIRGSSGSRSKRFPTASARITERKAAALYRDGEQFWWVGVDGNLIAPYDPRGDRTEYVIVTGDRRMLPEAVGLLAELRAARPDYVAALSEIASLPDGGFGMMDAIFRRPVRVLRAGAPEKIRALFEARGFVESRGWEARAIDLRFADRIILVGAYGAGNRL
jgi:hypothetical protein